METRSNVHEALCGKIKLKQYSIKMGTVVPLTKGYPSYQANFQMHWDNKEPPPPLIRPLFIAEEVALQKGDYCTSYNNQIEEQLENTLSRYWIII